MRVYARLRRAMPGHDEREIKARGSDHLHGNGAEEVLLADVHAAMTQDRVGRGEVEVDVGQYEVIEIIVALHLALVDGPERKGDLAVARRIDRLGIERLEEADGPGEAVSELRDRRLFVLIARRLDAGEPRPAILGEIRPPLHLPYLQNHVRGKPPFKRHGW